MTLWNQRAYAKRIWNLVQHWQRERQEKLPFLQHMTNASLLPLLSGGTTSFDNEFSAQRFAQAFPESHHEHEPYSPAYLRAESPAVKVDRDDVKWLLVARPADKRLFLTPITKPKTRGSDSPGQGVVTGGSPRLVLTMPQLKGETRNPLEFLRVIGDDHAIFGQGVRGEHQVQVADGLTLTFQRGSHLGIVVSRVDGPRPHLETSQPGLDHRREFRGAELGRAKTQLGRDDGRQPDLIGTKASKTLDA